MDRFRHALTAYKDVAFLLKKGFVMYVTDVEAAFPMLPLAPCIWMFFLFKFFADNETVEESLFMHLFGDFGAAGLPGTFKLFFDDCVIPMARFALRLTLPMVLYVDDLAMIGQTAHDTNAEMKRFQEWCEEVAGIVFKILKDKAAATLQLYVGFWWDSISLTRTLDESKLVSYLALLDEYAKARSLTLRERRSIGGKMIRAIMTLPPGASCLLSSIFLLMHGLTLGWQARRTNKEERSDFLLLAVLLRLNAGKGYFSFDNFIKGLVEAASDASKESRFAGGGYWTRGVRNTYRFFRFGGRAARHTIMVLEGFTSLLCGSDNGYLWRNHFVKFWIDNQSYAGAGNKGRSRSYAANVICKRWFVIMVRHAFIAQFHWLSTLDNLEADDLSRDREADFLRHMMEHALWGVGDACAYICRHPQYGEVVTFEGFDDWAIVAPEEVSAWTPEVDGVFGPLILPPLVSPRLTDGCVIPVESYMRGAVRPVVVDSPPPPPPPPPPCPLSPDLTDDPGSNLADGQSSNIQSSNYDIDPGSEPSLGSQVRVDPGSELSSGRRFDSISRPTVRRALSSMTFHGGDRRLEPPPRPSTVGSDLGGVGSVAVSCLL